MNAPGERVRQAVLGMPIDVVTWDDALGRLFSWGRARQSRYVCITNAHSVVTGTSEAGFASVLREADMVTPDGAPVAWMLRRTGHARQDRINGPDLMWKYCERATEADPIFLFGGTQDTLDILRPRLAREFPRLRVAGAFSPPFRAATAEEDAAIVEQINASGATTVWVSLGCPKQERWMREHRGRIAAPMIGVGAAFDYHAGTLRRAPMWMRNAGLEWLHRLASEPRRLWRRYLVTNSLFMYGAAKQLLARGPSAPH